MILVVGCFMIFEIGIDDDEEIHDIGNDIINDFDINRL